ncbi:MAG: hypothetical protein VKO64_06500, partial [Candidatus Sericytochromatia bacterium]|nr:hypothetical protein [Candidatus Sericytochromatia bacterium]
MDLMDDHASGGDPTWDTNLGQDDATLNDLLSFYQTGQEAPPPFVADDAVPAPFQADVPSAGGTGGPTADAVDAEIEALIRSFQDPAAVQSESSPVLAAAPESSVVLTPPPSPAPEVVFASPPPPAPEPEVVFAPPPPPAPEPEVVFAKTPDPDIALEKKRKQELEKKLAEELEKKRQI